MFFTLFGAVAVVGVLGAGIMSTMRGPLTTMVEVNRIEETKAEMGVGLRLLLLNATSQDGDVLTEPNAPSACTGAPSGAGCPPSGGPAKQKDAWGTSYAYCAWNNGSETDAIGLIHKGAGSTNNISVALISAGPDRKFQTSCADAPTFITPSDGGGDDIVRKYNYNDAVAGSDGLWALQAGASGDEARVEEEINVGGGASAVSKFEGGAQFGNNIGVTTAGGRVTADVLTPYNAGATSFTETTHGLLIGDSSNCKEGMLRVHAGILERCKGSSWDEVGKSLWENSGSDGMTTVSGRGHVGIGTASTSDALAVNGSTKLAGSLNATGDTLLGAKLDVTGAGKFSSTLDVTGAGTFNSTLGVVGAAELDATLGVDGMSEFRADVTAKSDVFITENGAGTAGGNLSVQNEVSVSEGSVTVDAGDVIATAGRIEAVAGDVIAGDSMTAANDITATTGDITASAGDIAASAGNVSAGKDVSATGKVTAGTTVEAGGNILATGKFLFGAARDKDLTPRSCNEAAEKPYWDGDSWECKPDLGSGSASGGEATLGDVLGRGEDGSNKDIKNVRHVNADYYCPDGWTSDAECVSAGKLISGSQIWKKDGPGSATGEIYYSGGNVGIGTNDPAQILSVKDPSSWWGTAIEVLRSADDQAAAIYFGDGHAATSSTHKQWYLGKAYNAAPYTHRGFALWSWDGTQNSSHLVVNDNGMVGIGIDNAKTKLDVGGTLKIGDGTELCNSVDHEGALKYDAEDDEFYVCRKSSSGWEAIGSGSGTGTGNGGVTEGLIVAGSTQSLPSDSQVVVTFSSGPGRNDFGTSSWTANKRFTVPSGKSGWYLVTADAGSFAAEKANLELFIRVNGNAVSVSRDINTGGAFGVSDAFRVNGAKAVYLNVGDYVELAVMQRSGATIALEHAALSIVSLSGGGGSGGGGSADFSNAVMAFNASTCPAGWSEYTPARGRFLRGIDPSGSTAVDPAGTRAPGSQQEGSLVMNNGAPTADLRVFNLSGGGGGVVGTLNYDLSKTTGNTGFSGSWLQTNSGTSTGSWGAGVVDPAYVGVTRPRNTAVIFCKFDGTTIGGGSSGGSGQDVSFYVHKNGVDQSVTAGTPTKVTWPAESFDTNNNFSADRFTPTVAGKYIVSMNVWCTDATSQCTPRIYKNGTVWAVGSSSIGPTALGTVAVVVDMNGTTDYLEGFVLNQGGTVLKGGFAHTFFTGALIGGGGSGTDTLAGLSCTSGQVAAWNGTAWACATVSGGSGGFNYVESAETTPSTGVMKWSHGLSARPTLFGVDLVFTADVTLSSRLYKTGERVRAQGYFTNNSAVTISADATDVIITSANKFLVAGTAGDHPQATNYKLIFWAALGSGGGGSGLPTCTTAGQVAQWNGTAWACATVSGGGSAGPSFSANKNGTNQSLAVTTWTKLIWPTEEYDTANAFASDKFTPQVAGKYLVTVTVECLGVPSGGYCVPGIYKNGGMYLYSSATGNGNTGDSISAIVDMNGTTDYLEAYGYTGGTGISGSAATTRFAATMIGGGSGSGLPTCSTAGQVPQWNGTAWVCAAVSSGGGGSGSPGLLITEKYAANTFPAGSTANTWVARNLNTVDKNTISGASLATKQITLPAGTYYIEWAAKTAYWGTGGMASQTRLYNVTDSTASILGLSCSTDNYAPDTCLGAGYVTLTGTKTFEVQHNASRTRSEGFGQAANLSTNEIYSYIKVWGAGSSGGDTLAGLSCSTGQVAQWNGTAWACATVSGGGGSVSFMEVQTNGVQQNLTSNQRFNTTVMSQSSGSLITHNVSNGQLTLKAGRTYLINAEVYIDGATSPSGSVVGFDLYNVTASTFFTDSGETHAANSTASWSSMPGISQIIKPAVDTTIEVRAYGTVTSGVDAKAQILVLSLDNGGGGDTLAGLSCTTGQVAQWNGTAWACATVSGGSSAGPSFSVNKASTQSIAANTPTKVTGFTEVFDSNSNFTADRFTPTVAGKYLVFGSVYCQGTGGSFCVSRIVKNGTAVTANYDYSSADAAPLASAIVDLNGTTDYVELWVQTGTSVTIGGNALYTHFEGAMIGGGGSGSDTLAGLSCTSGQFAQWNGTAWACATVSGGGSGQDVSFLVTKTADQTVTPSVETLVTWESELFDTTNSFSSNRFTPSKAGKYLITLTLHCGFSTVCISAVKKNSGPFVISNQGPSQTAGGVVLGNSVSGIVDMNGTTDYLEAFVYNTGNTVRTNGNSTSFSGILINGGGSGSGLPTCSTAGQVAQWNGTAWACAASGAGLWTDSGNGYLEYAGLDKGVKINKTSGLPNPDVPLASGMYWDADTSTLRVDGNIEISGELTDASDIRLKDEVRGLRERGSMLDRIRAIEPVSFKMKRGDGRTEFGVVAQQLEEVFPELVATDDSEEGFKSVNYTGLIAPLIMAAQELDKSNEALRVENGELAAEVLDLREQIEMDRASVSDLKDQVALLNKIAGAGSDKAASSGLVILFMLFGGGIFALLVFAPHFMGRKNN